MVMEKVSSSKAIPWVGGDGASSGLGFGCMGITAFYGTPMKDEDALTLLRAVYDSGCRHFDTAEIYKTGNPFADSFDDEYNETILGDFFNTVERDSYTVATKFMPQKHGGKSDYGTVKKALTASLKRLNLDYVDLYYSHRVTTLKDAIEFVETMKKLKEEGMVRAMGISEISAAWLEKIHQATTTNDEKTTTATSLCHIDALQMEWSLLTRNIEEDVIPMCQKLGITIVAYSPLARNLLAPSSENTKAPPVDWRGTLPRFSEEQFKTNTKTVSDIMNKIAAKHSCSLPQISLAWLFQKAHELGVTVVPIPGTTKIANVLSNVNATAIQGLDKDDMTILESLADKVAGARGDAFYISMGFESKTLD